MMFLLESNVLLRGDSGRFWRRVGGGVGIGVAYSCFRWSLFIGIHPLYYCFSLGADAKIIVYVSQGILC